MIARSRQTTAMIAKTSVKNRNDQLTYAVNQHEAFAKRRQTAAMVAKCCQESTVTMIPGHRRTSAVISSVQAQCCERSQRSQNISTSSLCVSSECRAIAIILLSSSNRNHRQTSIIRKIRIHAYTTAAARDLFAAVWPNSHSFQAGLH